MKLLLLTLTSFACLALPAKAVTLYFEDFSTFPASFTPSNNTSTAWRAAQSTTAQTQDGSIYFGGITNGVSPSGGSSQFLFVQHRNGAAQQNWFLYTPTLTTNFSPNTYVGGQLDAFWSVNNTASLTDYQFAIQVGGSWYAASPLFSTAASNPISPSLNLLTTTWLPITYDPDTDGAGADTGALSLGSTTPTFASLFSSGQQITGIGYYIPAMPSSTDFRTVRWDNITINATAVPEPTRLALLSLALSALILPRRRK